jgi:peptide/nickel transport system substrate-binding protein
MAVGLALTACSSATPSSSTSSDSEAPAGTSGGSGVDTSQIVIDSTFDIKTVDPGREFEPMSQMVVKACYDTLLTYADGQYDEVSPNLASFTANEEYTEFTITLADGRVFSDGSPVTADDVVFSLTRLQGIEGNPAYLLAGVTVTKVDDQTVKLTTENPNPALPSILTAPPTSILNSKVVQAQGGTTGKDDAAEVWLNANSAGSGPYTLEKMDLTSEVILVKNPAYNGPQNPTFEKVILRNTDPAAQKMNIEAGDSQVALGLYADAISTLADNVEVESTLGAVMIFAFLNANEEIDPNTPNPELWKAVKQAINYDGLVEVSGEGAKQATGLMPSQFPGGLQTPDLAYDLDAAKATIEAAGLEGTSITLSYPNDVEPGGVSLQTLAERLQAQLGQVGITLTLAPAPMATEVDPYRNGEEHMGLWYWSTTVPEGYNFLPFSPGQSVGLRAGWVEGSNKAIEDIRATLTVTGEPTARAAAFEEWNHLMNAESPFIPLIQPGSNVAHAPGITGIYTSPTWVLNVAALGVS